MKKFTKSSLKKSEYLNQMKYFVSNYDIVNIFKDCKIIKYADLDKYKDIYELLPLRMDFVFLLTESEFNLGHWTLIIRHDSSFEYFDSYGNSPKSILSFTPKFMNDLLGNSWDDDLGKMIKSIKKGHTFSYNKTKYQDIDLLDIATCGRWCILKVSLFLTDNMNNKDFRKLLESKQKEIKRPFDEIICILVNMNN
jgi:hypothetical protein